MNEGLPQQEGAPASLQAALSALQHAEQQARDLIRYAPTGIYEVDFRTGKFREVNDAMCEILGYTREELMVMTAFDLLDGPGKVLFADRIRRTLAGQEVDPSVEYNVLRKDGSVIYAVLSTRITYENGQPAGAFVIAHDVTERRRAADELREKSENLARLAGEQEAILNAIADGLAVYDLDGRIVRLNAVGREMLGYSAEEQSVTIRERSTAMQHPRKPDGTPYEPEEFPAVRALRGEVVRNEEMTMFVPARGSGPLRVAVSSAPIRANDGTVTGCVTTFRDTGAYHAVVEQLAQTAAELERRVEERTAEYKRASEQLRELSHRVVELQENERYRVANQLYNDEGQRLAAVLLNLKRLKRDERCDPAIAKRVEEQAALLDEILLDMHNLAVDLRPVSLDRLGLKPALSRYALGLEQKAAVEVRVELDALESLHLARKTETSIYRIVQEACDNALRHGRAACIAITARHDAGQVTIVVEDDGTGFDVEEALREGGLGLLGMRERARAAGGTVTFRSSPGQGAAVTIAAPDDAVSDPAV